MNTKADPVRVGDILRDCAAQYILPRYRVLKAHEIDTKSGPNDLVTVADRETEAALERILPDLLPGSVVIGEEAVSAGLASTGILTRSDTPVWVTDPVDGTSNFVNGNDCFAVMLALVTGGEVTQGWIYDVPGNRMMITERGGGAWMDGERMHVAAPAAPEESRGLVGKQYFPKNYRPFVEELKTKVKTIGTLGCAGHEYLRLAGGQADFGVYNRMRPWDHLPGALAVREAGGMVVKWDGTPYMPGDEFGVITVSSNRILTDYIHDNLVRRMVEEYAKTKGSHRHSGQI